MRFVVGVVIAVALDVILALWLRPTQAFVGRSAASIRRAATGGGAIGARDHPHSACGAQRDLKARNARYDPVALLHEEEGRLRPHEIFESEPRDPKFAPVFERRVSTRVETLLRELGLADKVWSIHVECKTLSCTTVLQIDPKDVTDVYDLVNGVSLGDVQSPSYGERHPFSRRCSGRRGSLATPLRRRSRRLATRGCSSIERRRRGACSARTGGAHRSARGRMRSCGG